MAIQSAGVVLKTPSVTIWQGNTSTFPSLELAGRWSSYAQLYREQLWVSAVVNKLAKGTARLPLKVYERDDLNRPEARDHPYARLLRNPSSRYSPFFLWLWASSTFDVYGEFFLGKIRDAGGRPVELVPLHPTCMFEEDERDGRTIWRFQNSTVRIDNIGDEDLVHPRTYNPDKMTRGVSPLEPLRRTLENEDAARRATSAFWRNGGRPSIALSTSMTLSPGAHERVKADWNAIHQGADNFGKVALLEEGLTPHVLSLNSEEAQYIESRKLNREEVCGAYDIPPPVVHILDHATYSNITEQMRSMYRDTMAPRLKWLEAELEAQLRGAVRPGASEPDFGDSVYAEFLMDEVLRGDFEQRVDSWATAIQTGQATPAEARRAENRPFIPGTDRLYVNSAVIPVSAESDTIDPKQVEAVGSLIRAGFEPAGALAALGLPNIPHTGLLPITVQSEDQLEVTPTAVRTVMGRLSRTKSLDDVQADVLTEGLNGDAEAVAALLSESRAAGDDVNGFKDRLRAATAKEHA